MRGQAWPLLVGNKTRVTAQIFEHYKAYMYADAKLPPSNTGQSDVQGESKHLIEVDIPRTFPDLNSLFE